MPTSHLWVDRVLELANLDELPGSLSKRDTTALRKQLGLGKNRRYRIADFHLPSGARIFGAGIRWAPDEPRREQARLRATLDELAEHGRTVKLCKRLSRVLRSVRVDGIMRFEPSYLVADAPNNIPWPSPTDWPANAADVTDYRFDNYVALKPSTLEQWCSITLAELVSQGFDGRVRRCELASCRRFFVNLIRRGPPAKYCCESHASQSRVARKRENDARRRRGGKNA